MVGCKLCDSKSSALATSQVKKTSEIFYGSNAGTSKSTERKIGENKALGKGGKARFAPYSNTCEKCGGRTNQPGAKLCHKCAFKAGKCVHGKKVLDTKAYNMSSK